MEQVLLKQIEYQLHYLLSDSQSRTNDIQLGDISTLSASIYRSVAMQYKQCWLNVSNAISHSYAGTTIHFSEFILSPYKSFTYLSSLFNGFRGATRYYHQHWGDGGKHDQLLLVTGALSPALLKLAINPFIKSMKGLNAILLGVTSVSLFMSCISLIPCMGYTSKAIRYLLQIALTSFGTAIDRDIPPFKASHHFLIATIISTSWIGLSFMLCQILHKDTTGFYNQPVLSNYKK